MIEGNGLTCAIDFGGFPGPGTACLGLELNGGGASAPPRVADDYVFASRAETLVGVRQRGGDGAEIVYDTIEVGFRIDNDLEGRTAALLLVGSPAIDTGVSLAAGSSRDIDGNSRPKGSTPDRGCHEAR